MTRALRLGILGSTRGSNLIPLNQVLIQRKCAVTIGVVISNRKNAGILIRAAENNWPAMYLSPNQLTREEYDLKLSKQLQELKIDLIVLIGYIRILSAPFIKQWRHKIINAHPSLLPAFAGKMDKTIHQAVLDAGLTETGCTIHEVNEEVDAGPILIQKKCPVYPDDTIDTLKTRVQKLEVDALADVIQTFYQENSYESFTD